MSSDLGHSPATSCNKPEQRNASQSLDLHNGLQMQSRQENANDKTSLLLENLKRTSVNVWLALFNIINNYGADYKEIMYHTQQ